MDLIQIFSSDFINLVLGLLLQTIISRHLAHRILILYNRFQRPYKFLITGQVRKVFSVVVHELYDSHIFTDLVSHKLSYILLSIHHPPTFFLLSNHQIEELLLISFVFPSLGKFYSLFDSLGKWKLADLLKQIISIPHQISEFSLTSLKNLH